MNGPTLAADLLSWRVRSQNREKFEIISRSEPSNNSSKATLVLLSSLFSYKAVRYH